MPGIEWDTSEVNHLSFDLTKAPISVQLRVSKAVRDTAKEIEKDQKILCPVLTGAMKKSIRADIELLSADIGTRIRYAHFVEYGTSRQAPEPFINPPFTKAVPAFQRRIDAAADDFL
jgi:HK97 gp10 family phage protein